MISEDFVSHSVKDNNIGYVSEALNKNKRSSEASNNEGISKTDFVFKQGK